MHLVQTETFKFKFPVTYKKVTRLLLKPFLFFFFLMIYQNHASLQYKQNHTYMKWMHNEHYANS